MIPAKPGVTMKSLAQQMAVYAAYHRDTRNKATHFIGVPLIVLALMMPLTWLRLELAGFEITLAALALVILLVYYLLLDAALALAVAVVLVLLLYLAGVLAGSAASTQGWLIAGAAFGSGWVFQLLGHWLEGRRPALVDNLFQVFVAPIFLVAEIFFLCGLRAQLHHEVQRLSHSY